MKIRSIELENFRQFYDRQEIFFSTDDTKNVTLIHAENGVGKTAFLNAILWCLFEKTTENFSNPKNLLNDVAADEGEYTVSVRVEFEEDGRVYSTLRLENRKTRVNKFEVSEIIDGNYNKIKTEPSVFINSVIPKDMAEYFFFQGEGVGSLAQDAGGGQIKRAIRDILGFKVAEEALSDLSKIKSGYRSELKKVDKANEISSIEDQVSKLERSLKVDKLDLEENEEVLERYSLDFTKADRELTNSNHEAVKLKHSQRKSIEEQIKRREQELRDALAKKTRLIRDYSYVAFAHDLSKQGLDFIDEEELKGKLPAPLNVQVVKDIVESAMCLCGAEIVPGTAAFDKIQELTKDASDPALLNRIHKARSQLTVVQDKARNAKSDLVENFRTCEQKEKEINS